MGLVDQDNRSRDSCFLSCMKMALIAQANSVFGNPDYKTVAVKILSNPENAAVDAAKLLATDSSISAVKPIIPRDLNGKDNGNGWSYAVSDDLVVKAVSAHWDVLVEVLKPKVVANANP